jgi:hypothetical protein
MSKFGLVVVLMLMAGVGRAQDYFVFIQADNNQPFYVRVGEQVYPSSAAGHLILAQLKDSTYIMAIGLPGQSALERRYTVAIRRRDLEFRLKDQGDRGWGLYDEQAREMKTPEAGGREVEVTPPGLRKDDAFSRLMAGVVQDTAVLYNTYAMSEPDSVRRDSAALPEGKAVAGVKPVSEPAGTGTLVTTGIGTDTLVRAPVTPPPVRDSSNARGVEDQTGSLPPVGDSVRGAAVVPVRAADSGVIAVGNGKAVGRSRGVVKLSERKLTRSVRMSFADRSAGKRADTIVLFIPVDTPAVAREGIKPVRGADSGRVAAPPKGHGPNPDSPLLQNGGSGRSVVGAAVPEATRPRPADTSRKTSEAKGALPFVNSDCHNYATDYDVDKLRVKLLEISKDDDRIIAARKVFKTRCFATRQIRALSEVFGGDAGKYRFFEAAYPFCSDSQFGELGSLLTDPVYSGKFRAMVEH